MGEDHRRVGQEPAPVAGMVRALAQVHRQVEADAAARAHEERRRARLKPRPVRGDQHVGGEPVALGGEELGQAGGARLLRHLDHDLGVEAEPAARGQHRFERRDVDEVLALVVGGAAAVEALSLLDEAERVQPLAPLVGLGADHVAVAVGEHGLEPLALDPFAHEKRAAARIGVVVQRAGKAHRLEPGAHGLGEVAVELGPPAGLLAFGLVGHERGEVGLEPPLVEVALGMVDGGVAGHASSGSRMASPQGDMISVQPLLCAPRRITPAGQAKA